MTPKKIPRARRLVLVLGDQLDRDSAALRDFDDAGDAVLMAEVTEEATYVPQHKLRLALFFSAMRHFRDDLEARGRRVHYVELDDPDNRGGLGAELQRWAEAVAAERVVVLEPGDWRVRAELETAARRAGVELEVREDGHFLCSVERFREFAEGRKTLVMEHFYRRMRRGLDLLMDDGRPRGGQFNFDADNRESFGADGPGRIKAPRSFRPDAVTQEVLRMVERRFPDSPGSLGQFDYPVTRDQARAALRDFVKHRLAGFGPYQDAMVTDRPYLYHSRLSAVLNLHLLGPRETVEAAVRALDEDAAPLASVEGFVRQIVGWREFVRGVYWTEMPGYAELNGLEADAPMPRFMWTAETEMNCVRQSVGQLVDHAYAHHIQRLMVLGLYALLLGVRPYDVHRWHMSMYADAIDWVSLPNVLGMSQHADGGIVGTKPYCASGSYVDRMSDYCTSCRYDPKKSTGDDACPFTVLYWDFLARHRKRFAGNRRMGFQLANVDRKDRAELRAIRRRAEELRTEATAETYL